MVVDEGAAEQKQPPEVDIETDETENLDEVPVAGDGQPLVDDDDNMQTERSNENELLDDAHHVDDDEAQNEDVESSKW